MEKIKSKRDRVKFASDNITGACPEVLDAILKANEGDSTPYGNDQISTDLQNCSIFANVQQYRRNWKHRQQTLKPLTHLYLQKHIYRDHIWNEVIKLNH